MTKSTLLSYFVLASLLLPLYAFCQDKRAGQNVVEVTPVIMNSVIYSTPQNIIIKSDSTISKPCNESACYVGECIFESNDDFFMRQNLEEIKNSPMDNNLFRPKP